jgi:hypothetical protein
VHQALRSEIESLSPSPPALRPLEASSFFTELHTCVRQKERENVSMRVCVCEYACMCVRWTMNVYIYTYTPTHLLVAAGGARFAGTALQLAIGGPVDPDDLCMYVCVCVCVCASA